IIDRFVDDGPVDTVLPGMVTLCNMANVPVTGTPGWKPGMVGRPLKDYQHEHAGRIYHFGSEVDRWIFKQDPDRYKDHMSVADRMVAGHVQPPSLDGLLQYFSLGVGEQGNDSLDHAWIEAYEKPKSDVA
ncbi:MAG: toluene monooxygenase, partial [Gammaproteobacteria bacterium]